MQQQKAPNVKVLLANLHFWLMVPAALQHYNEGGHELAINASKTKRRKRKEKRMAPFRQLRHHEVAKEVTRNQVKW